MTLRRAALPCTLMVMLACALVAQDPPPSAPHPTPSTTTSAPEAQIRASEATPAAPATAAHTPAIEAGNLSAFIGLRVHDIEFRSPSIHHPDRLLDLIQQKTEQPLDKQKLRRSIQMLYATGRFSDIQVEAERSQDNQLSLVFVAKENYFIGRVTLYGAPRGGPTDHQLINASKFELGQLYSDEKLQQSLQSMKRVLEDGGYYQAKIKPHLNRFPQTQQIDVTFWVEPGERARVGHVIVTGSPGYSPDEVMKIAKLHPGDAVSLSRVNRALQRLRNKLQKQDRLEAQVSMAQRFYDASSNTVDYLFNIVRGPLVDIRVQGAKLRHGLIKRYVPVYEENAVDADLLNEGSRNLREYFQAQGFFDSEVSYRQQLDPIHDRVDVVYTVEKSERHKLIGVVLDGNKYFPNDIIRDRMNIQPASILSPHGTFSTDQLSRDVQSIQELYEANGFRQAHIRPEVQDDYGGKNHIRVVLHITEGPQTLVSSLKLVGVKSFPESAILERVSNLQGQPFSDANIATDRDEITNFYFNRGFPVVSFESSATPVPGDPTGMKVTYTIDEGKRVFVNQVLISGLHYTRPFVVDRELRVHPGDPLSQADMLDTQTRLYDLGIFNGADIGVQNPEGEETHKDVLLNLYEAPRYTIDYGLGFEVQTGAPYTSNPSGRTGASPRVTFDITRTNFRGRDHTIYFKSHFGRLQQRALVSYEAPHWFNRDDLKLSFNAFYDNTRDVTTFTSSRLEGSVQAQQNLSRATTLLYRFSYRLVKVDASSLVIDPNLIPLLSRPERIGMPSFTYFRDTRDNPIDSHKGRYIAVDAGISSRIFGSEASFGRFLVQHSTYKAFNRKKPNCETCYVVAFSTRMGFEPPFGAPGALVPLPERFFSGGANSLRGFSLNQAGPRDHETGNPLGGESMFVNNIELRLPPMILPFFGNTLSPVIFHDMGNVFASTGDLFPSLFRVTQKNRQQCELLTVSATCNFNYLSHAVGGGIRYKTPIGPVRLDIGYSLNPPLFPIRSQARSQTLRHVNFFFSIGQTF